MDVLLALLARVVVAFLQALPLGTVAWLGRVFGALAYVLDGRHRNVAQRNITECFREKSATEVRSLARENFQRIGESFACAVKTASFHVDGIRAVTEFVGAEKFPKPTPGQSPPSVVCAVGHFANFELLGRSALFCPGYQVATTYRGLRQAGLTRVMQALREKSGSLFFERRKDADALKTAMNRPGMMLGLFTDQHAGDRGVRLPFFGRDCSTSVAPGVLALRYGCPLFTVICYRVAPGRWRIEVGDEIPTHANGQPRPAEDMARDMNRAFETAIRRDPANWFWVHNRWKEGKWRGGKEDGSQKLEDRETA
jgi:lauroyl/myristoyl acyltransferase